MTLPAWRPLLKGAQHREGRSPSARWLQLATVADDGTPRVRTLVFRGWKDDDQLLLFSDGRSSKILDLTHQPQAELCWLFPKAKQQFRLRGVMTLTQPEDCPAFHQQCWRSMRDSGRALWAWPKPGSPYDSSATFVEELGEDSRPPNHFLVLALRVHRVELLDLNHHPHRRLLWSAADEWKECCLNP